MARNKKRDVSRGRNGGATSVPTARQPAPDVEIPLAPTTGMQAARLAIAALAVLAWLGFLAFLALRHQ
jgi:hypothetical protein